MLVTDPTQCRTGVTRGNATATTYPSYDAASRLLSLTQNLSGTTQDLTLNFSYTDASQLSARATSNTLYDWAVPTVNKAYVPDGLNRYSTVAGTAYGYDLNGNLTSDGTRTFTYDVENRLRTVVGEKPTSQEAPGATIAPHPLASVPRKAMLGDFDAERACRASDPNPSISIDAVCSKPVRPRHEYAIGVGVIQMAPGDATVGSIPNPVFCSIAPETPVPDEP